MTRIVLLSTDPGIRLGGTKGAAVHLEELARALAAEGARVLVLAAGAEPGAAAPAGVRFELLPVPPREAGALGRLHAEPVLVTWLARRLRRFGAGVLYERLALHSAAGGVAARRLGIPHLVELNAPLPEEARRYRTLEEPEAAELLERRVLAGADRVLAVSPPLADYARRRGAGDVEVLQNGVDADRHLPRARRGAGTAPVAVFSGSLRPWHGVGVIAEAWRVLGGRAPRLLVVGDGPERPLLQGIGAELVGAVPPAQVPGLLATADIGLAPYGADSPAYFSPLKLFEYLAAGLATVVAALPAVEQVVSPREAVLVPPGDAGALADAVARLSADPSARAGLGAAGRALVLAEHTWRHRARRVLEVAADAARPLVEAPA